MEWKIPNVMLDVEAYRNYFQVGFLNVDTGNLVQLEMFDGHPLDADKLRKIMLKLPTMSFNGLNYDLGMIFLAISIARTMTPKDACAYLKRASDSIIQEKLRSWQFFRAYNLDMPKIDHVDIFEVAPGQASLKIYGGRVHSKLMQDLPIEHDALIHPDERPVILTYNHNDLLTTADLRSALLKQLELRCRMSEEYGQDLRSKSDAQIAEAVITSSLKAKTGVDVPKPSLTPGRKFSYKVPDCIKYQTPTMQRVLQTVRDTKFVVMADGKVQLPKSISEEKITIGSSVYRMGIGGLHSSEEKVFHKADDEFFIVDRDVASYYPAIILNQKLYPKQMGQEFLNVYRSIVNRRLLAKRNGDKTTADSLKITINGSFGKFGSRWSKLYSPDLLIQVTLSGQLYLLMLIETLECAGIQVISANTDGVVIKCPYSKADVLDEIITEWERATCLETEETRYSALYSRDVNNYIAVKTDGEVKTKGAFAKAGLMKNPANEISVEAVVAWLTDGRTVEEVVEGCDDIRKMVNVRQVAGGAVKRHGAIPIPEHEAKEELITLAGYELQEHRLTRWGRDDSDSVFTTGEAYKLALKHFTQFENEDYLGKAIRWVYAKGVDGPLQYKSDNRIVPRSYGAKPVMNLSDYRVPKDVDRQWYIDEAYSILRGFGIPEEELSRHPLI